MEGTIHNLVISSIKRDPNGTAVATTKNEENNVNGLSKEVSEKLTTLFKGGGLKVGEFNDDIEASAFEASMKKAFDSSTMKFADFRKLSAHFADLLARKLNKAQAINAKDGYLITYYYSQEYEKIKIYFLCTVFLHRINGTDIDDVKLVFEDIERIDLDSLNLGAKICINDWVDEIERPISFKLGKGTGDVRRYFQEFLGCTEPSDFKADTNALKEAIAAAGRKFGLEPDKISILCTSAQSYCLDRLKNYSEEKISLEALAVFLFSDDKVHCENFMAIAHDDFKLSDTVGIDRMILRTFSRIQGGNKDYKISFNADALNKTIIFDRKEKTLTFKDLPQEVLDEVLTYLPRVDRDGGK